jgi:N-acetylmuramoyl-L-alanine amidase
VLPLSRLPLILVALLLSFALSPRVLSSGPLICLDPGHGGDDPGAVGCDLEEADVVLDVGLRLQALIEADPDLSVIMTRMSDMTVSLQTRADYANDHGAARFASIHCNASAGTASGIETYAYTYGSITSFDQRDHIQAAMTSLWPHLPDRGGKTAGFAVIKNTMMPATLSELAFIDNCASDALLLASSVQRQAAAKAHYDALRASLGLGGGPIVTNGLLRGVVYEDLGVGAADMSVRLPGAQVSVIGAGDFLASTEADDPTARWEFSIPAGGYEVSVSSPGYLTSSRSCVVVEGQEVWCSVGLTPGVDPEVQPDVVEEDSESEPESSSEIVEASPALDVIDASGLPEVAEIIEELLHDEVSGDSDIPGSPEASPELEQIDPGAPEATADGGGFWVQVEDETDDGGASGCAFSARGRAGSPEALALGLSVALFIGLLFRRRRVARRGLHASGSAPWVLLGLGLWLGAASLATPLASPLAGELPRLLAPSPWDAIEPVDGSLSLADLTPLTPQAGYTQPRWSHDGEQLIVAGPGFSSLYLVSPSSPIPSPRLLARGPSIGYEPRWAKEGDGIACRAPGQRASDVPAMSLDLAGRAGAPPVNLRPGHALIVSDDVLTLVTPSARRRVSPEGARACCATFSPDGRYLVFLVLGRGLYLQDLVDGRGWRLGPGNHPSFSPDSGALTWDRCLDDGERLTGCELFVAELRTEAPPRLRRVVDAPPGARFPGLGAGARAIAFEVDGAIWRASLRSTP